VAALGCGQDVATQSGGSGQSTASTAGKADSPSSSAMVYEPSGPAAWDSFDPEVELVGRDALLDYLNNVRAEHGLEPVTWDDKLQKAAELHADYIKLHFADHIMTHMEPEAGLDGDQVSIHFEDESLEGFTGQTFVERGEAAGYTGFCFGEVVAFKPTAVGAARSWLESLYHRFPLLDVAAVHVGYTESQIGPVRLNVMEVGSHD
jgi:uncharacterized protein YkwD